MSVEESPKSRRLDLRVPSSLHATLQGAAHASGLSLNAYCVGQLEAMGFGSGRNGEAATLVARARAVAGAALSAVVLHGSWVRGEASPSSDVDALIVVDSRLPLIRDLYRAWDAEPITWRGHRVDPQFVHLPVDGETSGLWAEVAVDGAVLFEHEQDLSLHLARIRRAIATGRLVRRVVHGQPYWTETARSLAGDFVERSAARLRAIEVLYDSGSWADVVRESQETIELALKGLLRAVGIDPPRVHDVAGVLVAERSRLPTSLAADIDRLVAVSRKLCRDRERAFYGAEELAPSELYRESDADKARDAARLVVERVSPHIQHESYDPSNRQYRVQSRR